MTLVTDADKFPGFAERLDDNGIPYLGEAEAAHQDIYPMNVGLANLMPAAAMKATELQWLRFMGGNAMVQTRPHFIDIRANHDELASPSRSHILEKYQSPEEVSRHPAIVEHGMHILIMTGDNVETEFEDERFSTGRKPIAKEDITYHDQLVDLIEYSKEVPVTVFSCLAAHFALQHLHGLDRRIPDLKEKILGVYEHDVVDPTSPLMRSMGHRIVAPHSRWGNVSMGEIEKVGALRPLAVSDQVGWLALQETLPNGNVRVYLQGHPEYDRCDLDAEYKRDRELGDATLPENYYPDDDCNQAPPDTWQPYTRVLHENIHGLAYAVLDARRRAKS